MFDRPEPGIGVTASAFGMLLAAIAAAPESHAITSLGWGPVRIGMTAQQAIAAGRGDLKPADEDIVEPNGCYYLQSLSNDSIGIMVEENRVVRVEAWARGTVTPSGVQVGDPESRVRRLYKGRMSVEDHKYVDNGHYFVIRTGKGTHAVVVEVYDGKVQAIRGGAFPAVMYVEGCS